MQKNLSKYQVRATTPQDDMFKQVERFFNINRLLILLCCIICLIFLLSFERRGFFPNYVPIFLLIIVTFMFFYFLIEKLKILITTKYARRYPLISYYMNVFFSYFSIDKTKFITDSFRAKTTYNQNISMSSNFNNTFETPSNNTTIFNKTINDRENIQNPQNRENNFNYLNMIKNPTERKRNFSSGPQEIKRNDGRFSDVGPIIKQQNYNNVPSNMKNIRGLLIFIM